MQQIISDNLNGTLTISDQFNINATASSVDATPYFTSINSEYILSFLNLQNVSKITKLSYDILGKIDTRFLKTYYRISRDGNTWTEWVEFNIYINDFPIIDTKDPFYLDIKWIRSGSSVIGNIRLLDYKIEGILERDIEVGDHILQLLPGDVKILKAPFIYKVFRIDDIEIISPGILPTELSLKYRYSQDNSKTWSNWEILNKENISTVRINPIRFFQIEYSIENKSTSNISIQDINLIGDFQNISKDYFKTNLFGIRECCMSNIVGYYDSNGNFIPNSNSNTISGSGGQCDTNVLPQMTSTEKSQLYNPYQQSTAMNLLTKLSTDAQQIFGHRVIYFVTDADAKGQDHSLHEYQLYNVVCEGDIKVSIEGNNFPDSQILMNQFDLNLFETMEAHITKQQFKEIFGPQRRPSKEDFLYFCDVNRMYQVEHAQQFRNFNNAAIYYKLILKKYSQKSNVKAGTIEIKNKIDQLTRNTTIEELFGVENIQDKASVANKDQFKPLTKDPIRLEYLVSIDKELIENGTNIISKSNYDLTSIDFGQPAVRYKNLDPRIKVSDNIGFYIWFNINNYIVDEVYNFFNYYDDVNNLGWKSNLSNDNITITINETVYNFNLSDNLTPDTIGLEEDVWYCYVMNIDQRQRKLNQYIYKRDVDLEEDAPSLNSTILRQVYENEQDIIPHEFELENIGGVILSSDMKITNIRLFIDVIPKSEHNKILNQYIIGDDSKYLVFADNANTRLKLPYMPLGNE
jgi:hypothetical protein